MVAIFFIMGANGLAINSAGFNAVFNPAERHQ